MKFDVTETAVCRRRIAIEVEPEVVEGRISDLVKQYRRTKNVPGFRPGRATDTIIRRRFGSQIRAEVLRSLIPEVWGQALDEHKLTPVDQPEFDTVENEPGQPLKFTGEVEVKPQFEVKDYKGIEVTREIAEVTDEQVDEQLELIRQQRADEVPVDRPAQTGDIVLATIQQADAAGIPIIGKKEADRRWQLGGVGSLSEDMDEQLVGISKGESRLISFHYRDDLYDEARRGQEDRAAITVTEVFERHVPEFDEELLKDLGDFETLDDLRKAIRDDLERHARLVARRAVHEQLRDHVLRVNEFDVPESMVERALASMLREHQDHGHEHDKEEFSKEHRADAVEQVRTALALEKIAEQEGISVADEKVDERVAGMSARMGMNVEGLRKYMIESGRYENLRSEMIGEATLDFLEEQAKVKEVTVKAKST